MQSVFKGVVSALREEASVRADAALGRRLLAAIPPQAGEGENAAVAHLDAEVPMAEDIGVEAVQGLADDPFGLFIDDDDDVHMAADDPYAPLQDGFDAEDDEAFAVIPEGLGPIGAVDAAEQTALHSLITGRILSKCGKYKGAPYAAILMDKSYCFGLQRSGWKCHVKLVALQKFVNDNYELWGNPEGIKAAFGSILFLRDGAAADDMRVDSFMSGEGAEEWLRNQRPGISNRLIRKFGACYAFLDFHKPHLAPTTVVQWGSGRRLTRFVPHHSLDTRWMFVDDKDVLLDGDTVPLREALVAWHAPIEQSLASLSKWIARWQLCLSPTWSAGPVDVVMENDIVSDATGNVLSEGAGWISERLADEVAKVLRIHVPVGRISALQIRLGGCKGVLYVVKTCLDNTVHVRYSMMKIESNEETILEVVKFFDDAPNRPEARLNKQIVPLIEAGVLRIGHARDVIEDRFSELQQRCFQEILQKLLVNAAKTPPAPLTTVANLLAQICSPGEAAMHQHLEDEVAAMRGSAVDGADWVARVAPPMNDSSTMHQIIKELRLQANAYVQNVQYPLGRTSGHLLIVPDHTGTLQEGECCGRRNGQPIVADALLVYRTPLFLVGHVRKLRAVRSDAVESTMRTDNVLVLSAAAQQPMATAMYLANGDYDGDTASYTTFCADVFQEAPLEDCNIPEPVQNQLRRCDCTSVRTVAEHYPMLDEACAELLAGHAEGVKGLLTSPWFRAVAWRGAQDDLTVQLAHYALRAMDVVKTNENSKALLNSMRRLKRQAQLEPAVWQNASSLQAIGVAIVRGVPRLAAAGEPLEELRMLSVLRGRAEALYWLCSDGRFFDAAAGSEKYDFLIGAAGLEDVVYNFRLALPQIGRIGALAMVLPTVVPENELVLALAAIRVYAERKSRLHSRGAPRARSTFDLYANQSELPPAERERLWHFACHCFIHARRCASNSRTNRSMVGEPSSWKTLDDHMDFAALAHRVVKVTIDSAKRRRLL